MTFLLCTLLALLSALPLAAQPELDPSDLLLDATFVPCSDSTESLLVLRDGRAVYAVGNRGTNFKVSGPLLEDLVTCMKGTESIVDTEELDSCTTLGVILEGPRFVLINTTKPSAKTKELYIRVERLRKFAEKKLGGTIDRLTEKLDEEPDSNVAIPPSIGMSDLLRQVKISPVAREWRCRGSVVVIAKIQRDGSVRQAFVTEVKVQGKCQSLLTVSALRAVLLATFVPAQKENGKPTASWVQVEVPFRSAKE